jgi:hypothetical protein
MDGEYGWGCIFPLEVAVRRIWQPATAALFLAFRNLALESSEEL